MALRHLRFTDAPDCAEAVARICAAGEHAGAEVDFCDGTMFGAESSASGTSIGAESSASGTSIGAESSASGGADLEARAGRRRRPRWACSAPGMPARPTW